ncbi:tetratricopeptide repeat domain 12, isoform CRA_b [Rattus norvegicus]|uniref:Tetratricopeptide repeat protein 12 n=1 Tax=Rattus norvegicus TaxID=10116 RepID=A6J4C1_RAT|nr:tetratricopeptide repeat domain 12, isoform CRA_b [Rattus norvegicus]
MITRILQNANEMNPDAFLASVEKDAKERAKRRRENRVLADALKEKGNEAFVKGDYETAIFFYSEGLGKLKDMKVLYTNRAQAYIKLGDYQKALVDCDWALKCDENCTKAYFHMGKAHLALKNYSKSKECYQKIGEINPKLKAQVKEHLNQVTLREKADLQEKKARESLDSGKNTAMTTRNLLETLSKPGQTPLFYAGGIEILTEMMTDCKLDTSGVEEHCQCEGMGSRDLAL